MGLFLSTPESKMNPELYKIAVNACAEVYETNIDLGTTEFNLFKTMINGEDVQVLAIAGSNEIDDWIINFNLFSKKGIKIGAYKAAMEIRENIFRDYKCKLLVCGHSKAGATAIAFKKLFNADYCVAFAPARSLRYWAGRKMENTTIFIDPDDPVSRVGFLSFGHPDCEIIKAKDNHLMPSWSDHDIENWVKFVEGIV